MEWRGGKSRGGWGGKWVKGKGMGREGQHSTGSGFIWLVLSYSTISSTCGSKIARRCVTWQSCDLSWQPYAVTWYQNSQMMCHMTVMWLVMTAICSHLISRWFVTWKPLAIMRIICYHMVTMCSHMMSRWLVICHKIIMQETLRHTYSPWWILGY